MFGNGKYFEITGQGINETKNLRLRGENILIKL